MATTIKCPYCEKPIQVDEALKHELEEKILKDAQEKHEIEIVKVKTESIQKAKVEAEAKVKEEIEERQKQSKELQEQVTDLLKQLRASKDAESKLEIEMQKKLLSEQTKIREEEGKAADERHRLKFAEQNKQLEDARKANEELQRKLNQGSQQMQGEILELDLESSLSNEFRDDAIAPVDKGVRGADIKHIVKSPLGNECGVILWEIKRTKTWSEGWIQKLKTDLRETKANIPVIITESMPKDVKAEIEFHNGVWIARPSSTIILAALLRKSLLDVAREKAFAKHRDTSADALYTFVTSHEFVQQIEAMVEVYMEMNADIMKEKAAFDRIWAKRENQAKKLLGSTANIIGSMQGQLGTGALLRVKGLDLISSGE